MWSLVTPRGQHLPVTVLPAVLGSGANADVRVPHESVAAEHARLTEGSAGTLRIEALSEDAIVGVAGRRVPRALLRDGDELVLGRVKFTLRTAAAPAAPTDSASPGATTSATTAGSPGPTMSATTAARDGATTAGTRPGLPTAPIAPLASVPAPLQPRIAVPRRPLAAGPAAAGRSAEEPQLVKRGKTLQFGRVEARRGLLNADLSQMPAGQRLLLLLGGLALMAALGFGAMRLMGLFA